MKEIDEVIKEFHKKYDFSESSTLEYDNLVGIADFLKEALTQAKLEERSRIVGVVEGMKAKFPKHSEESYLTREMATDTAVHIILEKLLNTLKK